MSRADLVTVLAWVGTGLVAASIGAWARYAILRNSADEEPARLRLPVVLTVALVVALLVLVLAEP